MKIQIHNVSKQSSRKLYSHNEKGYISLSKILEKIVKEGQIFSITKKNDKSDITLETLNQALYQSQKEKLNNSEVNTSPRLVQEALTYLYDQYDGDLFKFLVEQMGYRKHWESNSGNLKIMEISLSSLS